MNNLDKLKKVWFNLNDQYEASGMGSKREFLMKYLGYRDNSSGLSKLLTVLKQACEFNADHEPLPEYKEDYDALNLILSNADKLVQSGIDIEDIDLDSMKDVTFEEQESVDAKLPSFSKGVNSIDIISAIITKFAKSFYNVKTQKHMTVACINDNAALVQSSGDYQRIVTYLSTKITCDRSKTFDQLLFRYILKNNIMKKKFPVNVLFLDTETFTVDDEGNILLNANNSILCKADTVKVEKRSGDLLSYQGFKRSFPDYTVYRSTSKEVFDKTFTIIGFKYEDI